MSVFLLMRLIVPLTEIKKYFTVNIGLGNSKIYTNSAICSFYLNYRNNFYKMSKRWLKLSQCHYITIKSKTSDGDILAIMIGISRT